MLTGKYIDLKEILDIQSIKKDTIDIALRKNIMMKEKTDAKHILKPSIDAEQY